jgi:predicted dienelactone hydrolase
LRRLTRGQIEDLRHLRSYGTAVCDGFGEYIRWCQDSRLATEAVVARLTVILLAFVISFGGLARADTPVQTMLGEWHDAARNDRIIPYKIYYPQQTPGARPVVIFSHGLGGNREASEFLLSYLAANGYIAVAVQHPGSDTPAVFGAGRRNQTELEISLKQAMSPGVAVDRFRDIPFAISMLTEMNASDATLRGRLDMAHVGMSGHSYGGITTQALAGQTFAMGSSFADPRVGAAIIYSPSKPRQADATTAFADVRIPTFHMTGTEDKSPIAAAEMTPEERLIPYHAIHGADKFLLVLTGGDHMVFSGKRLRGDANPKDERRQALVQRASLAFWDAYLLNKPEAKTYLTGGGFNRELGDDGKFEFVLK